MMRWGRRLDGTKRGDESEGKVKIKIVIIVAPYTYLRSNLLEPGVGKTGVSCEMNSFKLGSSKHFSASATDRTT